MRPRIVLAGLGETGTELAEKLGQSWDVVAIEAAEPTSDDDDAQESTESHVQVHYGDASSALVLKKACRGEFHAAVACAGDDEVNFEFLRLAHDVLQIENRFALMYELAWATRYERANIDVVSQDRSCAAVLASRIQPGQHAVTGIGLGQGEIVQVDVLPNSSVIGRRLAELHPRRWLVGAVYRQGKLLVPHGDTVLQTKDQVLVIGDPDILPSITTLIRTGESEFPLQYGSHLVVLCSPGVETVLDEVQYLIDHTRARALEAISCNAERERLSRLVDECESRGIAHEFSCSADNDVDSLLEETRRHDVGVLVLPPEALSFWARVGLSRTRTAKIVDKVDSPVLICRHSYPYDRVLLGLAELPFHNTAAQLAIDLVRILGAELHLAVVQQPDIVQGSVHRAQLDEKRREIENLAGLYHLKVQTEVLEGNPIHELEKLSHDYGLLVLPYLKGRKSFLTRPDVGLNVIHRAACSVMVMPF